MNELLKQFSYLVHFLADYIPTCSKHFLFLFCQIWHVIKFSLNFQSTKITFILWISPANGQTFSHCFHSLGSLTTRFVSHLNGSGQTLPNRVISAMFCSGFFGRGSVVTLTDLQGDHPYNLRVINYQTIDLDISIIAFQVIVLAQNFKWLTIFH